MKEPGRRLALLKGTLDMLIMKALSQGPTHGYGITTWLDENSGGRIVAEDSAVYQALHRMESRRLIEAKWGVTENKRKARFYRLTKQGRPRCAPMRKTGSSTPNPSRSCCPCGMSGTRKMPTSFGECAR